MKATIILSGILVLLICTVDSRKCYECSCRHDWQSNSGTCETETFLNSCTLNEVGNQYCLITSTYNENIEERVFEAITSNNLQDSHFIQAIERISLSGNVWLPTIISSISYGCDWDGCNQIALVEYLPESFQIDIDQVILNLALINGTLPAQACYACGKCINELTVILCERTPCTGGICYIDELHNYITTAANNCTYNFYSICEPLTNPVQAPNIRIRATYYIDLPQEKQLEIDEVDIRCTKDYCNSIEVVEYLKGQIRTTIDLHPDFRPSRPNVTTTTTQSTSSTAMSPVPTSPTTTAMSPVPTSPTTTAMSPVPTSPTTTAMSPVPTSPTTTAIPGSPSTRSYPIGVLYLLLTLLLL